MSGAPRWVGLAARLMTDSGQPVLRVGDAGHARLLRQMGARGLHEPLLATLRDTSPDALVQQAGRALRALLPGRPKPVAALTRDPDVVAQLLTTLDATGPARNEALRPLAGSVLFSLALSSALHVDAELCGPLLLRHEATRRGVRLGPGQTLRVGPRELCLDGRRVDPWGPELAACLSSLGPFAVSSSELPALPSATTLDLALRLLGHATALGRTVLSAAEQDQRSAAALPAPAQALTELFDSLALLDAGATTQQLPAPTLPLAVGRARVPPSVGAETLALALVREGVLHRLTLLRLVDPLVRDEASLPALLAHVDAWAEVRLGRELADPPPDIARAALTPLGERAFDELHLPETSDRARGAR